MRNHCLGCFKPASNPSICISCKYATARQIVEKTKIIGGFNLSQDAEEEVIYEIACRMNSIKKEDSERMHDSILAKIIAKCSDTVIYLCKKRFVELDDLKVILFELEYNEAYITNGDVVIRISDLPGDALDGLRNDLPAYDYMSEKFIPNPLPYELEDMVKVFHGDYLFTITLPVQEILDKMYTSYPQASYRRSRYAVIDVGYGFYNGSIIIPKFEVGQREKRFCTFPNNKVILISPNSKISNDAIQTNTSYVGYPVRIQDNVIYVDVYKKFEDKTIIGFYNIDIPRLEDDIHPFDLELYSPKDVIKFPLVAVGEKFNPNDKNEMINIYKYFEPVIVEAEYLYNVLLLFGSFGYKYVNLYVKDPSIPVCLEGVKLIEGQPTIEAVMAIVATGKNGKECERLLESTVLNF